MEVNEQQNKQAHSLSIPIDTVREQGSPIIIGETQQEISAIPSQPEVTTAKEPIRPR